MKPQDETFWDHWEALRQTLIRCFAALILIYPLAYLITPRAMEMLLSYAFPAGTQTLHYFGPMDLFRLKLETALILDLMLSFPWLLWQVWHFLLPALYARERRLLLSGILLSTLLFAGGAIFSVLCILPLVMQFSVSFATVQIQPLLGIVNVLTLAGWLMLAFGVMFQTPLAVLLAVSIGLVSTRQLRHLRPYVMTIILTLSAILTPPDVFSQLMLAIPTWLLYEAGLLIAAQMERKSAATVAIPTDRKS
jgi:sec-independent protein translocase protein TatC